MIISADCTKKVFTIPEQGGREPGRAQQISRNEETDPRALGSPGARAVGRVLERREHKEEKVSGLTEDSFDYFAAYSVCEETS